MYILLVFLKEERAVSFPTQHDGDPGSGGNPAAYLTESLPEGRTSPPNRSVVCLCPLPYRTYTHRAARKQKERVNKRWTEGGGGPGPCSRNGSSDKQNRWVTNYCIPRGRPPGLSDRPPVVDPSRLVDINQSVRNAAPSLY